MYKCLITLLLICISTFASGDELISYKAGTLELIQKTDKQEPGYELGFVTRSKDTKLIKESTLIKYKVGNAFGVIIENLKPDTKVKATWTYPLTQNSATHKYMYPEHVASGRHSIYWSIDEGEQSGSYILEVCLNNKESHRVIFNVQKQ